VLPLADLSGQTGEDYFADGMTDELITSLGKISALTVIAHSSVMEYKKTSKPLRQIARALGVGSVLEGTVLRAGDRVRVSVRLVRAATGRLVWSESYERSLSDVLALQSELALAVAREIQVKLLPREREQLSSTRSVDPRAHEAYLLGRYHWSDLTYEGLTLAIGDYRRATAIDSGYAMAYAGLADAYYGLSNWYFRPDSAMPLVRDAVTRALALDPGLADAHALRAVVHAFYEWDFARAEVEYRRAVELNPSSGTAHLWYAYFLTIMGRFDAARAEIARAEELDPLSSWVRCLASWPAFYSRNYDQAIDELLKLAALDPHAWFAYSLLGEAYEQKGQYPQAIDQLRMAQALGGNPWVHAALARTFAEASQPDSARSVLRELDAMSAEQYYVTPYGLATVYAALNDRDRAFQLLERAASERSEDMTYLRIDPRVDRLRSDPRFAVLIRRLRYPS
jgi:TolB-like protein/Flp pilus assembly protein TadD